MRAVVLRHTQAPDDQHTQRRCVSGCNARRTVDPRVAEDLVPRTAWHVRVLGTEHEEIAVPRVQEDELRPVLRHRCLRCRVRLFPRRGLKSAYESKGAATRYRGLLREERRRGVDGRKEEAWQL